MGKGPTPWVDLVDDRFKDDWHILQAKSTRQTRIWQTDPSIPDDERESTTITSKLRVIDGRTRKLVKNVNYHVHIAGGKAVQKQIQKAKKEKTVSRFGFT